MGTSKTKISIDVSGVLSEAQPIVQRVAEVYLRHTAPWFIGLAVHGSAVKGGIIPNCSDIDFQLYLSPNAFMTPGVIPLELGFKIRRALGDLSLEPFRYIQCITLGDTLPEGFIGLIPGTYHRIAGKIPFPEATDAALHAAAANGLSALNPSHDFIIGKMLGPGGVRLERGVRLLCTKVWPVLFQVLILQKTGTSPAEIWGLTKSEALALLPEASPMGQSIRAFYQAVRQYYPTETSLEDAVAVIQHGFSFLNAAKSWWTQVSQSSSSFK